MSIISRKKDHIKLVKKSQVSKMNIDNRFNYEPIMSGHPQFLEPKIFLGKSIGAPIFISSITGGSYKSKIINSRLGKVSKEFNIPMGLGSIRPYLEGIEDKSYRIRNYTGYDVQIFGNIGIAQIEEIIFKNKISKLTSAIRDLELDGLIIHINPLQEWVQDGGDFIKENPLKTLKTILPELKCTTIVKEVGCGFGPRSLEALIKLPIDVIDLAAFGGTNFTKMELLRGSKTEYNFFKPLINIGHTPKEMILHLNRLLETNDFTTKDVIISGGIKNFLDGYYYNSLLQVNSIYGYAGKLLKLAVKSEKKIMTFIEKEIELYSFAEKYLNIKE